MIDKQLIEAFCRVILELVDRADDSEAEIFFDEKDIKKIKAFLYGDDND